MRVEFARPLLFLFQKGEVFDIVSWWNETEVLGRLLIVLLLLGACWLVGYTIRTISGR